MRELNHRYEQETREQPKHTVGATRLSEQDLGHLLAIFQSLEESRQFAEIQCLRVGDAPEEVAASELRKWQQKASTPLNTWPRAGPVPTWVKLVAANREALMGCALLVVDSDSRRFVEAMYLCAATKNPFNVFAQRCIHLLDLSLSLEDMEEGLTLAEHEHRLRRCPGEWLADTALGWSQEEQEIFVLPGLVLDSEKWAWSDQAMIPWGVFFRDLVPVVAEPAPAAHPRPAADHFPEWARAWVTAKPSGPRVHRPAVLEPKRLAVPDELTEDQEMRVATDMAEARAWLAGMMDEETASGQFSIKILGGKWTQRHRTRPWDAVSAYARTGVAVMFTQSFEGLQQSMRWGRRDFTRHQSYVMALAYCARMIFFFTEWEESGYGPHIFAAPADDVDLGDWELVNMLLELGQEHPAWQRGQEIRAILPGAWCG